ncbi:lipase [Russula emetica]|nr:lipase [Russula emetica]
MLSSILSLLAIFGIADGSAVTKRQTTTVLSSEEIEAFKPYTFYAAAAYCVPTETVTWSCGDNCAGNPSFQPYALAYWYVGWDPTLSSVIVAHQGTNPDKILADLTDGNLTLGPLDSTLFPGLSPSIEVHQGFANEQSQTAQTILAAVLTLLNQHSASSVVVGHSLGAALALLDSVYLPLHVPAGTIVSAFMYGLPRVGNADFANYEDPVPIVPGKFLGYVHPSGEVHIQDSGFWDAVGDVPTVLQGTLSDHDGPYDDGIIMATC